MLQEIDALLRESPGLKAGSVAYRLGFDKAEVSKLLHGTPAKFSQSPDYRWYLAEERVHFVELATSGWLTATNFETALIRAGCPLTSQCPVVKFVFGKELKILLDALSRLLALSNQLSHAGKEVFLDFTDCLTLTQFLYHS